MSVSDKYRKTRNFGQKVKVMIVDDSVVVRGMFSKWLENLTDIEVIATHRNGKVAVDNIAKDMPDVVLLDIEMPEMDGITALPLMAKACPSAKIIISSTLTTRNAEISLKAMALGAVDYVAKPSGAGGLTGKTGFKEELIEKIRVFGGVSDPSNVNLGSFKAHNSSSMKPVHNGKPAIKSVLNTGSTSCATNKGKLHPISKTLPKAIIVGSSTGGPPALIEFTKAINAEIDHLPVFITQHMPQSFTKTLAEHIAKATGRICKEGEDGENVENGVIYIAPGGLHMSLTGSGFSVKIKLDDGPQINYCKPSVDPLFMSASNIYKKSLLSVILTGMGNDGSIGAGSVIEQGGTVIVQDEKTSVVWGMPGAAVQQGVVCEILPLNNIGKRVSNIIRGKI